MLTAWSCPTGPVSVNGIDHKPFLSLYTNKFMLHRRSIHSKKLHHSSRRREQRSTSAAVPHRELRFSSEPPDYCSLYLYSHGLRKTNPLLAVAPASVFVLHDKEGNSNTKRITRLDGGHQSSKSILFLETITAHVGGRGGGGGV